MGSVLHRYRLPAGTDLDQFTALAVDRLQPTRQMLTAWPSADVDLAAQFWLDPATQAILVTVDGPEEYLPEWEELPGIEPFGWNTPEGDVVPEEVWQERRTAWQRATAHGQLRDWTWPMEHVGAR